MYEADPADYARRYPQLRERFIGNALCIDLWEYVDDITRRLLCDLEGEHLADLLAEIDATDRVEQLSNDRGDMVTQPQHHRREHAHTSRSPRELVDLIGSRPIANGRAVISGLYRQPHPCSCSNVDVVAHDLDYSSQLDVVDFRLETEGRRTGVSRASIPTSTVCAYETLPRR